MPAQVGAAGANLLVSGSTSGFVLTAASALTIAAPFLAVGGLWGLGYYLANQKKRPDRNPSQDYEHIEAAQSTIESPISYKRVVMGEVTTAGTLIYADSEGAYFIKGYALAAHEIEDVLSMSIDNEVLFTDRDGYVTSSTYRDNIFVGHEPIIHVNNLGQSIRSNRDVFEDRRYLRANFRLGTNDQTKDDILVRRIPSLTEHYRQVGTATAFIEAYRGALDNPDIYNYRIANNLDHEHERIWGGATQPPDPLFRIRGIKAYDPRSGKTEWTRNAACILGAILTNPVLSSKNDLDYDNFDMDAFKRAADACDEGFEIQPNADYPHGAVFRKYTLDGTIETSEPLISALQTIFLSSRTSSTWLNDKYHLNASTPRRPVMTLTDKDWQGEYDVRFNRRATDSVNAARGQYRDPENDGTMRDAPVIDRSGSDARRDVNLVMSYTSGSYRAQHIMHTDLNELMLEKSLKGALGRKAMPLQVRDPVQFVSESDPQNSGHYIVFAKEMTLDGTISNVILLEWDPEKIFDWEAGDEQVDIIHPTKTLKSGLEERN